MSNADPWLDLADPTARTVVAQVASLGYHISTFRLPPSLIRTFPGGVELHAVNAAGDAIVVRQDDDGEDDVELRAACLLAMQCGVELDDG